MATLFDRLSGIDLVDSNDKMAIHGFSGALNELRRGKFTLQQVAAMFSLDAAQQSQALTLKNLLVAAPQKTEFMRVFKDCLYLAENGSAYLTQSELISRLQDEVTDQGGTLP